MLSGTLFLCFKEEARDHIRTQGRNAYGTLFFCFKEEALIHKNTRAKCLWNTFFLLQRGGTDP